MYGAPDHFPINDDLVARMLAFIEHRNTTAKPFECVDNAKLAASPTFN